MAHHKYLVGQRWRTIGKGQVKQTSSFTQIVISVWFAEPKSQVKEEAGSKVNLCLQESAFSFKDDS